MPAGTVVSRGYLAPRAVDGVCGSVRATFERCAYVAVEGGPALVLHAEGRDRTPTSLCPATWPLAAAICVGDTVVGRAGHLKIGELVLDVRSASVWRPARSPAVTPCLADPGFGPVHAVALRDAGRRTGELLPALEQALTRRDAEGVTGCVAALVGRGPGLTPSGDDAIVGLLAVLHRLGGEASPGLLGPPVLTHLHRTCDISAHYLRLAVGGHFGERLIALCDALATGARADVEAAAVVATGATSGADALLGVVTGVRLLCATPEIAVAA